MRPVSHLDHFRSISSLHLLARSYSENSVSHLVGLPSSYSPRKQDLKDYRRLYNRLNRDKLKESRRFYYLQNLDKLKGSHRLYRTENKDARNIYARQYQMEFPAKVRATQRQHYLRYHKNPHMYMPRSAAKSWKTPRLVREYFESISGRLLISSQADWYRVSQSQLDSLGGLSVSISWLML